MGESREKGKRQQIAWSCTVEGMFWVKKGEERGRQGKVQREGSTGEGAKVGGRKEGRKRGKGGERNRGKQKEGRRMCCNGGGEKKRENGRRETSYDSAWSPIRPSVFHIILSDLHWS